MQFKEVLLQENNLIEVLEFYGYSNISETDGEIRCGRCSTSNPTSISILKNENISATDFGRNISGDIFTLIMEHKKKKFIEVVKDIKGLLNIEVDYKKDEENESVSRVFDDLVFKNKETLDVYGEELLDNYKKRWNTNFYKDGISIETQKKFDIGFDTETQRIVIPHRNEVGELCGVMGRKICMKNKRIPKYLPLVRFKKSLTLFGYAQNYEHLYNKDTIYIGESEKFVMQLDSMGYKNGVALSGSSISKRQIMLLVKLLPKRVVFCFDEGLDEMVMYRNANKFRFLTDITDIEVYMIIDRENKYLKKGGKESPTDKGKKVWEKLLNECIELV